MHIIHLKGTMCAGKTWCYKDLMDHPDVAVWDIFRFYVDQGCCTESGQMNWNKWKVVAPTTIQAIDHFIQTYAAYHTKLLIIESGGAAHVQKALMALPHTQIELITPSDEILRQRAEESKHLNHTVDRVLNFAFTYRKSYAGFPQNTCSPEVAKATLKDILST